MKYSYGLFRVAGLRSYQGEFTFSGLEEHLFSELRRFRSGKDEVPEKFLFLLTFCLRGRFCFVISFFHFSACIQQLNFKTEPRVFEQRKKVTIKIKLKRRKRKNKLTIYLYISAFVGVSYHRSKTKGNIGATDLWIRIRHWCKLWILCKYRLPCYRISPDFAINQQCWNALRDGKDGPVH